MIETNCRSRNGSDGNATSENEQGLKKGATEELFVEAPSRAKSHGPTDRPTYTKKPVMWQWDVVMWGMDSLGREF